MALYYVVELWEKYAERPYKTASFSVKDLAKNFFDKIDGKKTKLDFDEIPENLNLLTFSGVEIDYLEKWDDDYTFTYDFIDKKIINPDFI